MFYFLYLANERKKDIASGAIYVGRRICPITFTVPRGYEFQESVVYGRVVSLDHIRKKHLQMMEDLKLLRTTSVDENSYDQCKELLKNHRGKFIIFRF